MAYCESFILKLPLEQEPSSNFKRFIKDLQANTSCTCYAQYLKNKYIVQFFCNSLVNKNGTLGRHSSVVPMKSGLKQNEVESFTTRFNMAMSIPQDQRDISFEILEDNVYIPDICDSYPVKRYILKIIIFVKTRAAKITLDSFFTLTSY